MTLTKTKLQAVAQKYDTPCYVYDKQKIIDNYQQYQIGFADKSHRICYSVKANSNLSVLKILKELGSSFDIVSGGELSRVLAIGANPADIVFSGVGKTETEILFALLAEINCFNVESLMELNRIEKIAKSQQKIAPISIRVNPDVDAKTHPYISTGLKENKFGIAIDDALMAYQIIQQSDFLQAVGVDCHIGSQLTELAPFVDAVNRVLILVDELNTSGIELQHLDFGGGLGINYQNNTPPDRALLAKTLSQLTASRAEQIIIEPGRSIVGDAGVFLTKVQYIKHNGDKNFCIVDGAMNDLIRPSLYDAWQEIINTTERTDSKKLYDVVGPVCETGDFLGKDRELAVEQNDVLAVMNSGAYGFTMASNYNTRGKVAEILVDGETDTLIRTRETIESLFKSELDCLNED